MARRDKYLLCEMDYMEVGVGKSRRFGEHHIQRMADYRDVGLPQ